MKLDYSLRDISLGYKAFKNNVIRRFTNTSTARMEDGRMWHGIGSAASTDLGLLESFSIPEVASILNKRASAKANVRIQVVSKSTGEPVENNLSRLLKNPNWFQTTKEYINQASLFRDIYGNEYDYLFFGIGIKPENSKSMSSLVPSLIDIDYKSNTLYFMETEAPEVMYKYRFNGVVTDIPSEQIIHMNDNRIHISGQDQSLLKGESKLKSIMLPLTNIVAAYEARGILIKNRGALGILSNGTKDGIGSTLPLDDKEVTNVQSKYKNYGINKGQDQIIITNMALKWQKMGVDISNLKLFEEVKEDAIKIAEAYNYPPELLVFENSPTLFGENKKQAEKSWYQNSIIPETQEKIEALNKKFQTESKPYHITGTFDHLPIFQENRKEEVTVFAMSVTALSNALRDGVITIDEYREELVKRSFIDPS